jgi:UDP-N-acetylmuramoyl-tripeptide--D-alanyl-D-alanine ligase
VGFFIPIFMAMISIEQLYTIYRKHERVFIDSRLSNEGGLFFALKGDKFDGNDYALTALSGGADFAIVDCDELADVPHCILVDDVLSTLQELSNYHRRQLSIPVLAITGTNGKTTSKELIAAVLATKYKVLATAGNLNNHIGVPLTLLTIHHDHEIAVVEMGANHPSEIEFLCTLVEPDYGLITNVGSAHLEGFGSFEGVKKTKAELYRFIATDGKGIFINNDNAHLLEMAADNRIRFTYASVDSSAQLKGDVANDDLYLVVKVLFPKGWLYVESKLTGSYNLENILAAVRIGIFFDVDPLAIQKGIETYVPDNNRSQLVKKGSVTLLIDCYNANPSSMNASLSNFIHIKAASKVLVLGDMLELGEQSAVEHQKVIDLIIQSGVEHVYLVGENFRKTITPESFHRYTSVEELVRVIPGSIDDGSLVLIKGSRGIHLESIVSVL